ncbi:hypothetical protein J7K42_00845, partial [bacterium]|nr:hypothetical protein [bacterium]
KLQIAKAMEIAKNDPQIQQLMKDYGVEIKEVKLQDGKAYVLLALPEEKLPSELEKSALGSEETDMRGPGQMFMAYQNPETGEIIEFSGSVAEIDIKAAKVTNLKQVGIVESIGREGPATGKYTGELKKIETIKVNIAPLTDEEKARAIEIAKSDPKIQEMIPDLEKREIIVKPLPPLKLRLDEDPDNGMEVTSADPNEQKRANVIFKSDEMQDIITVNLTTNKVEGAVSYSTSRIEKPQSEYPVPIKPRPIKPKFYLEPDGIRTSLPDEGQIRIPDDKEIFGKMLEKIAQKNDELKQILGDNDYEILDVIKSKPIVEKTETSETIRVETATVVLEKESTGENYWITIDLGTNTIKSIKSE